MNFSVTEMTFWGLTMIAILSALGVVVTKNPVYSVLYLIITFFSIAGHYILLNAQFLAAVHVIVYAGAIMVLFLYVIMMLNLNREAEPHKPAWVKMAAVVAGCILMITLVGALKAADALPPPTDVNSEIGLVENLGSVLFKDFLIPFEVSSILFLAAMVGAVMIGKRDIK
jgi:NADH-quinone oxidoreductase subunit J